MPKRQYLQAIACFLAIPAVVIAGGVVFSLINPEMAAGHPNYVLVYQLMHMAQVAAFMGGVALGLILWIGTCFLVLKSRQRSLGWLALAVAGPIGFAVIAYLKDLAPAPDDLYQQFIGKLKVLWRVLLEIGLFFLFWNVAYEFVVLKRNLMISYESFMTGTPTATIIALQDASGGMWAFSEGNEWFFLVVLFYLLWPILFNLAGRFFWAAKNAT